MTQQPILEFVFLDLVLFFIHLISLYLCLLRFNHKK